MLTDAIIAGRREKWVQERLLDRGEDLTLSKALEIPQQFEMSQIQMEIVREDDSQISVVSAKPKYSAQKSKIHNKGQKKPTYHRQASVSQAKDCPSCGKDSSNKWNKRKCPAKGSTCSYCHKPNHWVAVCRKRATSSVSVELSQDPHEDEILNINLTQADEAADDKWTAHLQILSQQVQFRIDTSAIH